MVSQMTKRSVHNKIIDDYSIYLLFVIVIWLFSSSLLLSSQISFHAWYTFTFQCSITHYKLFFSIFTRISRTKKIEHKLLSILQRLLAYGSFYVNLLLNYFNLPFVMLIHLSRLRTKLKSSASCMNESLREISVFCGFYQIFFSSLISLIHSVCSNQQYWHIYGDGNWGNHVEWYELSGHSPEVSGESTVAEYWL